MNKRALLGLLVVAALAWWATLPPRVAVLTAPPADLRAPTRGALHVHTRRSDGTGTAESIAAAAAAAGLRFVVLTDHGDGTRAPDPPAYRHGVLCIDAAEISAAGGHVVAIGMPQAPYRLGGELRDVIEDIHRLGGVAIAAHPFSARAELAWHDWDVPVDGVEWLNADSEWRDESTPRLLRVLLAYAGRPAEALTLLLDRPQPALRRWDALTRRRRVAAFAGADAHARIGLRDVGEPYGDDRSLPIPSYESVFRVFSNALPDVRLTGDAVADAAAVVDAFRRGAAYAIVDGLATGGALQFTVSDGAQTAGIGGALPLGGGVRWAVRTHAPAGAGIVVLRDGMEIARTAAASLAGRAAQAGVYRVEVRLPGAPGEPPVPWIVSNPIYVTAGGQAAQPSPEAHWRPAAVLSRYGDGGGDEWTVERSPRSQGTIDVLRRVGGRELGFRFALGGTLADAPFAAMVMPAGAAIAAYDRLLFTARASRPLRVSVQLRAPGGAPDGDRWQRSIYLDPTPRAFTIRFDDMRPIGGAPPRPDPARVQSVLFVVDTVNARPGDNGRVIVRDVRYAR